jgi:hypothetical protein
MILQIKVSLNGIRPLIWRRIQVPASYSFWDLHVAIQDAMGWLDYHLHEFDVPSGTGEHSVIIGIPDDEEMHSDRTIKPGWAAPVLAYLSTKGARAGYRYDFGDGWEHTVLVEAVLPHEKGIEYPRCIDGRRKCPPEDVGGTWGYKTFLSAVSDSSHKEHESYLRWAGGAYDPDDFDAAAVRFDDPGKRWTMAFQNK